VARVFSFASALRGKALPLTREKCLGWQPHTSHPIESQRARESTVVSKEEEEELEPLGVDDVDDSASLEDLEDLSDEDEAAAVLDDDDDEDDEASLDEILAQRPAARRGADDGDEDEDDLLAFAAPEPKLGSADPPPSKITPIKEQAEFVCKRCHLVKKRSQLADVERTLCRDCV